MNGIGGLNSRVVDTSPEDTYLTPPWAVEWLLKHWAPLGDSLIVDPCACGWGGWTIGGMVAERYGHAVDLSDLYPRHESVMQSDFRDLEIHSSQQPRTTIVTNPPYNLLPEFVRWGLRNAAEVVVFTRFGFLCAEDGARAKNLAAYYQPPKRPAFELLPEEGERRIRWNLANPEKKQLDVVVDPRVRTGYRMSAVGVDHGWAVFRRGHVGHASLVIKPMGGVK